MEKIERLSGRQASVYTVVREGSPYSVFENFLAEYGEDYRPGLKDIIDRLKVIGCQTGTRADFFKAFEGKFGDLVCLV